MKKKTAQKTRAPADCRTFNQVCELERDGVHTKSSWLSVAHGGTVHIYNQVIGEPSTGNVTLTKREFMRMYEWYMKPQKLTPVTEGERRD